MKDNKVSHTVLSWLESSDWMQRLDEFQPPKFHPHVELQAACSVVKRDSSYVSAGHSQLDLQGSWEPRQKAGAPQTLGGEAGTTTGLFSIR